MSKNNKGNQEISPEQRRLIKKFVNMRYDHGIAPSEASEEGVASAVEKLDILIERLNAEVTLPKEIRQALMHKRDGNADEATRVLEELMMRLGPEEAREMKEDVDRYSAENPAPAREGAKSKKLKSDPENVAESTSDAIKRILGDESFCYVAPKNMSGLHDLTQNILISLGERDKEKTDAFLDGIQYLGPEDQEELLVMIQECSSRNSAAAGSDTKVAPKSPSLPSGVVDESRGSAEPTQVEMLAMRRNNTGTRGGNTIVR